MRETTAMEIRPDGTVIRDTVEGVLRWTTPAHATIDLGGLHEEHTFGLMNAAQMLDVDTDGHSRVWARVSVVPGYPEGCFDLRGSLVGDWTDGAASESFARDGTYVRGTARGNWSIAEQGYLDVAIGMQVRRYRIALATPDTLVSALDGLPMEEDPRGPSLIEARMR